MALQNALRDLFPDAGIDIAGAPDCGILFPDHGAFQFDFPPAELTDFPGIAIAIDFIDDILTFIDTTADGLAPPSLDSLDTATVAQDEFRTLSTPLDDLSALFPGIVWPPMSEWSSFSTSSIDPASDTPPADDTGVAAVQNLGPAGLDWWVTPDYDDDPGWAPGVITQPPHTSSAPVDGIAPQLASLPDTETARTDTTDVPRDEAVTSSLTLADLNEQYPGIVWPADWWML